MNSGQRPVNQRGDVQTAGVKLLVATAFLARLLCGQLRQVTGVRRIV